MKPKRIIWHHTADAQQADQFEKVNAYHKTRDFPLSALGFYVGYHYFIERDGTIRQAREDTEIGAHDQGENLDSIGVSLAGNFNIEMPSEAQIASGGKVIFELMRKWNIPITRVEPHRRDDTTDCPGTKLGDDWLIKEYLRRHPEVGYRAFLLLGEELKLI